LTSTDRLGSLNTATLHKQTTGDVNIPFNWTSSLFYELGGTRYFSNGLHVSAGYIYSRNSVRMRASIPGSRTRTAIFSAPESATNQEIHLGSGLSIFLWPPRSINNGSGADGNYTFTAQAVSLSFGYQF